MAHCGQQGCRRKCCAKGMCRSCRLLQRHRCGIAWHAVQGGCRLAQQVRQRCTAAQQLQSALGIQQRPLQHRMGGSAEQSRVIFLR